MTRPAAPRGPRALGRLVARLDADPRQADWPKARTWGLTLPDGTPVETVATLRAWLAAHDVTPAAFRRTPLYHYHRARRPWLAALEPRPSRRPPRPSS